jgi:hypothetical protein
MLTPAPAWFRRLLIEASAYVGFGTSIAVVMAYWAMGSFEWTQTRVSIAVVAACAIVLSCIASGWPCAHCDCFEQDGYCHGCGERA